MKSYSPPKLRQIVTEAVFRRKRIFLLCLYVVVGLVFIVVLLMHKRYEAEAKLMVQQVRSQAPLSTSPSEHLIQNNDVSTTEINNEVDLLQSAGVARRALGMGDAGATSAAQQTKVTDLQHHLEVEAVHQASTINVKLTAGSPEDAAAQLTKVIESYFVERAGAARSGGAAEFFAQQADLKAKQLDLDQQAMTNFEVQHQIADLDDQKKLQVTRVAAAEDALSMATAQLASEQSRIAAQKRTLAATPSRTRTMERSITNQYSQERLGTTLVELENHRTELLKRYPPTDRQVLEINEKIATTKQALTTAGSAPAAESATDVNPTYMQLSGAIASASGEVSGTAAQRAQLQAQVQVAQDRMTELEQATEQYQVLKRRLAQSQTDYTTYSQKRDEAQIAEALDNAKMFDVSLVQQPISSPDPVRPKPLLYLAAGFAFALFLGTLLALYADTSAEQVYTPAQLDTLTGTRTIATFADEDDADSHAERNRLEYRRVLVAIDSALAVAGAPVEEKTPGYCVAFTSALTGEGVSYLLEHLATEAARQSSSRVAVLDMDGLLRRFQAEQHVSFAMKYNAAKLYWTLALTDDSSEGSAIQQGGTQGQFSARLKPLLVEARKEFDYLLLDCPSFQDSTLASELDVCVDGYVAVVGAGKARKQNVEQMAAVLKETHAPVVGYCLNRRRYPVPAWLHRLIW